MLILFLFVVGSLANSTATEDPVVEPLDRTLVYTRTWNSRTGRWERYRVDFFYYYIY